MCYTTICRFFLPLFSFFLLATPSAFASIYVVDKKNIYCDDEKGKPFCTLAAAVAFSKKNDVIYVYANRYLGPIVIAHDLTIAAVDSSPPVIDGEQKNSVIRILPNARVTIQGVVIENGLAENGGGVWNQGNLELIDTTIRYNRAKYSGGGIYNSGARLTKLRLLNCHVIHNHSMGFDKYNIKYGGGGIFNNAELEVDNSVISGNRARNNGGAIYSVYSGRIFASEAEKIAESLGIANAPKRARTLNRKQDPDAVILRKTRMQLNEASSGGAINVHGVMQIRDSLIDSNNATGSHLSSGGGLYAHMDTLLTVVNTTISRNKANFYGGGIRFYSTQSGSLYNASVIDNKVELNGQGAGIYVVESSTPFSVSNSIIARNSNVKNKWMDCKGEIFSRGYNLLGDSSNCDWNDQVGDFVGRDHGRVEPGLIWQKNKQRYILSLESIAKDRGNPSGCRDAENNLISHDQYGKQRDTRCDMGAIEYTGEEYRS